MESSNSKNLQFSLCFDEFDAFAEATRGWDLDFLQLDSGSFNAQLTQTVTSSVILVECAFSRKIAQRGAPPPGYRTFGFAADGLLDLHWRGKTVGPQNLMLFPTGEELDSASQPGFHVFAFSISESALEKAASRRGLDSVGGLFPATDLISVSSEILAKIKHKAKTLSQTAASRPSLLDDPGFQESLELDLVDSVLDAITASSGKTYSRPTARSRSKALAKAIAIITDRANEPVTIAEISSLTEVTDRTLRYAFEEAYGLSPKQFLQAYRLNRVYRQLRTREGQKIADVANAWGFWHMGQFARDYRKMFGSLPSETRQVR